uniref:Fatty acyl-CoA reductase n=1 Tax=Leersia perrieri TaxID=77586 RepID=A0A0D9W3T7_9ORYZ
MKDLGLQRACHFGWSNTYVFTKAMGEMLLGHLGRDLPVVIIRPSIITSTINDPVPGWTEGLARTIDAIVVGYKNQMIPCFVADDDAFINAIPGDIVINAMMVAMAIHWDERALKIYNASSSLQNPLQASVKFDSIYSYFRINPRTRADGRNIRNKRMLMFKNFGYFRAYMILRYKVPLGLLHAVDKLSCGPFHNFDDTNLRKLSMAMATSCQNDDASLFLLDTTCIDWRSYLVNIHIPAALKCATAS